MTKGIEKNSQEKDFCSSRKSLKKKSSVQENSRSPDAASGVLVRSRCGSKNHFLENFAFFSIFIFFYALTPLTPITSAVGNEYFCISQYVSCCHYPYSNFPFFIADRKSRVVAFTFPGISVSSSTIVCVAP
jgi:hypothetical protein